jgi:hypothetical protein
VFGKANSAVINLSDIASTSGIGIGGFVINGENANDFSGYSVSSAGDVNGMIRFVSTLPFPQCAYETI